MRRVAFWVVVVLAWMGAVGLKVQAYGPREGRSVTALQGGWTLPPTAQAEKNPLTVNDAILAGGKRLFVSKCQRCHGPEGKGDGPDGDPEHMNDMDLTVKARAARNPDGVVFYKMWNGRENPKMPALKDDTTKDQVWAIVAYVQTLRAK
jgi:mono/diheme cytochrome c family protein